VYKNTFSALFVAVLVLAANSVVCADPKAEDTAYLNANPKSLEWFRQARFGLFVHWGPSSLTGQEISWSRGGVRPGVPQNDPTWGDISNSQRIGVPSEEYDNLYRRFNPVKFDARKWVALAKAAGMRYVVFTSKHHDGFCMFNSQLTDFDIMSSPYGQDICKELADACHAAHIPLGWYYSPPDWHQPDYYTENHDRYIRYFHNQIRELLSNYGKIGIMWFDGLFCTGDKLDSNTLYKMIRKLQPGILINNRLAPLPGDYDTPEQSVGRFQDQRAWESCITIGDQWGYRPNENIKSLKKCIQTLVRCACGDGNLLFNVGPNPFGEIEPEQAKRLEEMGKWLKRYGESIYGTRGGPYILGQIGGSTRDRKTIYIHVLDWRAGVLTLPPIPAKVKRCKALTGGTVHYSQDDDGIRISINEDARNDIDTIIVLELDRPASEIKPVRQIDGILSMGKPARASNVFSGAADYGPGKAFDGNEGTRWATDGGVTAAWLEVDLEKPMAFRRVFISEAFNRVQEFQLLCRDSETEEWRTFHEGTTIGVDLNLDVDTVIARHVRLNITKASDSPTIWEFQVRKS